MKYMAVMLLGLLALGPVAGAAADMIVDGTCDGAILGRTANFGGDSLDIGGDGSVIDDGWTEGATDAYVIADGVLARSTVSPRADRGVGQYVTNTEVANGGTLTFAFDYDIPSATGAILMYAVYGITIDIDADQNWLTSNGDGLGQATLTLNGGPEPAGNYTFTELMRGDLARESAGNSSTTVTVAEAYDYFFAGFVTDHNDAGGVKFDNISLVPEPATMSLIGLGSLALIKRRRT